MKTTLTPFTLAAIAFLSATSTATAQEKPTVKPDVPIMFGEAPKSLKTTVAPDPGEGPDPLLAEHVGVRMTLFGELHNTGTINLFYAYWYDGRETHNRRFYVEGHPYKGHPTDSIWVTVDATITKVDLIWDDKNEIRIHSYKSILKDQVDSIARASANSQLWLAANREKIDLNQFKESYPEGLRKLDKNWQQDFNKLPRKDDVKIRALDLKRGVVEVLCSQYTIEEVPSHHAHYIELVMFYDLKNDAPIRMHIRKSGYRLER